MHTADVTNQVADESIAHPTQGPFSLEAARLRQFLSEHAVAAALVAITAVGAGVRFATLGLQSFDHDETATAWRVLHPSLGTTLSMVVHLERTPPLYYVVAWLWSKVVGMGQVDLRALSAIFGTLTVPAAYVAARELAARRAGLVAAALVALNPFLVWYSQEARAYALFALLSTVGLYLLARTLRNPSARNFALWAAVSALMLCTHYFAAFILIPESIWLIAATRQRARALAATCLVGAVGVALVPLALLQEGAHRLNGFRAVALFDRAWETLVHYASSLEPPILGDGWVGGLQVAAGAVEAALLVAAVLVLWRRGVGSERRGAAVAASVGAAAFAIPVALALAGADFVDARNMIGPVVPLLAAAGIGLGASRGGRAALAAAGAVCVLFAGVLTAVTVTPAMQRPDWRSLADALGPSASTRVVVVPRLGQDPIGYYLDAHVFGPQNRPVVTRRIDALTRTARPRPPDPSFRLAAHRRVQGGYWLNRYSAPRPALVQAAAVDRMARARQPTGAMVTGPSVEPFGGLPHGGRLKTVF